MILPLLMLLAAQDAPANCDNPDNQADMTECAYRRFQAADREMNAQWRVTLAKMRADDKETGPDNYGPPKGDMLLASQRAWLAYRDAQCTIEGQYARGGTMEPMLEEDCKAQMTHDRTAALRDLIKEN